MLQKPPPIQWLPVFEAAARLLNFKQAAEELCVSPPAVSQQIKVLEKYLGVELFNRSAKKLRLTDAGEFYYQHSQDIIKRHLKSYREFERKFRYPVLHVSAPIFIAQELLIPNYTSFKEYASGVELRLSTGNEYVDFDNDNLDAALRFGQGHWPELDCRFVRDVEVKLVCSPSYLKQHGLNNESFISPRDLNKHVLLTVFEGLRDWKSFLPGVDGENKIICDSYFAMVRSAEEGLGIGIGLSPAINRRIRDGKLVVLSTAPIETDYAYWLVAPKTGADVGHIDGLYRWVKTLFDALE